MQWKRCFRLRTSKSDSCRNIPQAILVQGHRFMLEMKPCCCPTQGESVFSFLLFLYKTSHQHATQRMAGCSGTSGMVRSDPRSMSPFCAMASRNAGGSAAPASICPSHARSEASCHSGCASEISPRNPEEVQASAQASIIRLETLAFLDESDVREAMEDSLKRARSQAATVPVQDRISRARSLCIVFGNVFLKQRWQ